MPERFDPDALSRRLDALKKKQTAAAKQRGDARRTAAAPGKTKTSNQSPAPAQPASGKKSKSPASGARLEAVVTFDPRAFSGEGLLPPPEDSPRSKTNGALLRKQRQRLRRHRGRLAIEALIWFVIAMLTVWWCISQYQGPGVE